MSLPNVRGLVGLTNLHSKMWAADQAVQALVHEGMHSLIA